MEHSGESYDIWVCLKIGYIPNYSHLIGIMLSKTIGFRGTLFSDKPISVGWFLSLPSLPWIFLKVFGEVYSTWVWRWGIPLKWPYFWGDKMGKWWWIISRFGMMWVILGVVSIAKPYLRNFFLAVNLWSLLARCSHCLCPGIKVYTGQWREGKKQGKGTYTLGRLDIPWKIPPYLMSIWAQELDGTNYGTTENRLESVIPNVLYTPHF